MAAGRRLSATVKGLLMAQVGHGLPQRLNADPGGLVLLFLHHACSDKIHDGILIAEGILFH